MKILDLNFDCLLRILQFCNDRDLANLCRAHWFFRQIIDENIYSGKSLDLLMCGHRNEPIIGKRTHGSLSYGQRLSIAQNWLEGRYRETEYFHHRKMFPTKVQLERELLYITHAGYLRIHKRIYNEPLQRRYLVEIATKNKSDIADFVSYRETLFAGRVCGSCYIYEDGFVHEQRLHSPKEYLMCVNFANDVYVSSSDRCSRIWRRANEFGMVHLDLSQKLEHSFKTIQFTSRGERFYGGLYTDVNRHALREHDVESGSHTILNSNSLSIYDLKLKDDHVVFTANFDTTFRMYDRRSNHDEAIWEDPFDSSFYCLDYDGLYGVLCGAKYHGRVNLYDIRVPGKIVQLFFPCRRRQNSSPVYSLACDSRYLFVTTDHNLRVLDFKGDYGISRDYSDIINEMRRI